MVKEYYKILEISENATQNEIKKNYRKLVLKWHPDKNPGNEEAEKKTRELNVAYEILSDETKKAQYDNGGNVSVEKYGYDYGEEVSEGAIEKCNWKKIQEAITVLGAFYADGNTWIREAKERGEELIVLSDYHLVRGKKFLQLLNSYYAPIVKKIGWREFHNDYCSIFKSELGLSWMSYTEGWEGCVERFKRELDFARKSLGLPPLTDSDLKLKSIGGNNQQESPKIPGPGKPQEIEDGVADIEKYNNSFEKANNETVRRFWELRDKIYDKTEDYQKIKATANATSFEEMDSKTNEAEKGEFRTIWQKDEADKISETKRFNEGKLEKMKAAIPFMEKVIAESENSKVDNDNVSEPRGKKRGAETEIDIRNENIKKSKTIADELDRLINEATGINTYEELETKIKKIDEYQGEQAYSERQDKISQLKINLGNLDKDKFRALSIKKIKDVMKDNKIEESDLDEETKNELAKLENEGDINKINELENKVSEKIGKKGALNTLNDWLKQAKELIENAKKNTVKHLREELEKVKKGLYSFQSSTNTYQQSVYNDKEKEVKQMLEKLENYSAQSKNTQLPKSSFFRPGVIIPLGLLVVAVVVGAIVIVRRKRKPAKVK